MGIETWKRLNELEQALREEFQNTGCPTSGCPPAPRVHVIYAHYGARPEPDKALGEWRLATLDEYRNAAPKPREARVAADFLGAHFLWVLTKDTEFKELPSLEQPVQKTAEDGGTLVHFQSTSFAQNQIQTMTKAPTKIPDFALVDRHSTDTAGAGSQPGRGGPQEQPSTARRSSEGSLPLQEQRLQPQQVGGQRRLERQQQQRPEPPVATEAGEGATGIPKRRRLCLSIPGSVGEHINVDPEGESAEGSLTYPLPSQHNELRLYSVSLGFDFELNGAAVGAADPWTESTRGLRRNQVGKRLTEKSSSSYIGRVVSSQWGIGIAKYPSECTTTANLAASYSVQLGDSRVKVYKALKNIEGGCESIATYDGPKISWGINQWTLPPNSDSGELWQILAYIYDFFPEAFARRFALYGFGVWFESRASIWSAHNTYRNVIVYRIPCCGRGTRDGLDAVFAAGKAAAAVADAQSASGPLPSPMDLPPPQIKKIAEALRVTREQTTSFAMCHTFTTAGMDVDIQKAQAQWMSYRITSTSPVGKTISTVINEFLRSLGSNMSDEARFNSALQALGGEYSRAQVQSLLREAFSNDGSEQDWIDWPTRCRNASKTTSVGSRRTNNRPRRSLRAAQQAHR